VKIAGSYERCTTRLRFCQVPATLADEPGGDRGNAEAAATDGPECRRQYARHAGYAGIIGVCRR